MNTVFDHFKETPYLFLEISRGEVYGNVIQDYFEANGVFKKRSGTVTINDQESKQSESTLHIHPDEPFLSEIGIAESQDLVGHGIRKDGTDYEIVNATDGFNFDDNTLEHYRLTLQVSAFVEEESS